MSFLKEEYTDTEESQLAGAAGWGNMRYIPPTNHPGYGRVSAPSYGRVSAPSYGRVSAPRIPIYRPPVRRIATPRKESPAEARARLAKVSAAFRQSKFNVTRTLHAKGYTAFEIRTKLARAKTLDARKKLEVAARTMPTKVRAPIVAAPYTPPVVHTPAPVVHTPAPSVDHGAAIRAKAAKEAALRAAENAKIQQAIDLANKKMAAAKVAAQKAAQERDAAAKVTAEKLAAKKIKEAEAAKIAAEKMAERVAAGKSAKSKKILLIGGGAAAIVVAALVLNK